MTQNDNKNGRLIIVDPSLKDTRGHHYTLTSVIADSAISSGFDVIVFSNRSVDNLFAIAGATIKPVFSMSTYDHFKLIRKKSKMSLKDKLRYAAFSHIPEPIKIFLKRIRSKFKISLAKVGVPITRNTGVMSGDIVNELLGALLEENVTSDDHVLVHTADAIIYRSILQLIQKKYPLGEHPCYHLCTPYDMRIMPHAAEGLPVERVINYLCLMGVINHKVFLYAENELLADSLTRDWRVNVSTLDIPMRKIQLGASEKYHDESVFRVVYLGAAREEKGFHFLPDVVEAVTRQIDNDFRIVFVIQCSPQIVGYTSKIEATIKKLQKYPNDSVKLIMKQQSMDEYHAALANADVVLLCYQQENYRVRGSGIAVEAVANGKNIITTPGTYPQWLAGEAGISATGSKEIAAAILTIAKNQDAYIRKAKNRAEWFFEKTIPSGYVNKLLAKESMAGKVTADTNDAADSKLHHDEEAKQTLYKKDINITSQDDTNHENKYNAELCEAVVSDDGKVLFVKQISH